MKNKIRIFILLLVVSIITVFSFYRPNTVKAEENTRCTYYVDVKGSINNPGVYEIDCDKRIIDVINMAGGLTENADTSILNLSKKVKDEMYIIVYSNDEIKEYKKELLPSKEIIKKIEEKIICPDKDNDACEYNEIKKDEKDTRVNINTASKEELMTLTGIGESKADKIIEYRNNNKFTKTEDIKNVSGIGESVYNKIKDYIYTE